MSGARTSVAASTDLAAFRDATDTAEAVRERRVSATEVVDHSLTSIARGEARGAFWGVDEEGARREARVIDRMIAHGEDPGRFAGVPVAVKDCLAMRGLPTSCGVGGVHAPARRDATSVARLRGAGAIPIGKTAMNPLGWSADSEPPGFMRCENPRFPHLATGGSSSGSAAAVAADIAALGLGTDVAGSVRLPAAFCGVVGFKPALRSMPGGGVVPIVPSFDLSGILARSVRDCEAAFTLLRRRGAHEASAALIHAPRVAVLEDLFVGADESVQAMCREALEVAGLALAQAEADWYPQGFGRILSIEVARTWGQRVEDAPGLFTSDIQASVAYGREQDSAAERAARRALAAGRRAVTGRLARYDVVAAPTFSDPVPDIGAPLSVDRATFNTRIFSALGWPAIAIPCGIDGEGRPASVQLAARPGSLGALFWVADRVEQAVDGTCV